MNIGMKIVCYSEIENMVLKKILKLDCQSCGTKLKLEACYNCRVERW
jgi:hypothetical protein